MDHVKKDMSINGNDHANQETYPSSLDIENESGNREQVGTVNTTLEATGSRRDEEIANEEKLSLENDPFRVSFDGNNDKENIAIRLSYAHKMLIACLLSATAFCVTITSSVWSLAIPNLMEYFHISREVAILGITFYIFGLSLGPVFLSPISEFYGRKVVYITGLILSFAFQFVASFSNNYGSIVFSRFMTSFFGSAFLSVGSGTFSDIFDKHEIFIPYQLFVVPPFFAPTVGAIVSGFINEYSNFRWCFHSMIIFTFVMTVLVFIFVPETYKPFLLVKKAKRLRQETGDNRYYAPLEQNPKSLISTIVLSCERPILLLCRDPMMFCLCFYAGFVLALIYMFFICLPFVFEHVYQFSVAQQGLGFLGMSIGMILFVPLNIYTQKIYDKDVAKNNGVSTPEMRFTPFKYGSFFIPSGLMIIAWTSYSHVHWMGIMIGSSMFGGGTILVFTGILSYTVDAYRLYSASAVAANVFVRCLMSGIFPLFGYYVYSGMGVNWASFLMAMIGVVMLPMPFVFTKYGPYLRSKSPYAWDEE